MDLDSIFQKLGAGAKFNRKEHGKDMAIFAPGTVETPNLPSYAHMNDDNEVRALTKIQVKPI